MRNIVWELVAFIGLLGLMIGLSIIVMGIAAGIVIVFVLVQ